MMPLQSRGALLPKIGCFAGERAAQPGCVQLGGGRVKAAVWQLGDWRDTVER